MNPESPCQAAVESLSRARRLIALLITSSESFDYRKAKEALGELQNMIRELAREEARLRALGGLEPESAARIVQFPGPDRARSDSQNGQERA